MSALCIHMPMNNSGVKDCLHCLYVGMWHNGKKLEIGFSFDFAPIFPWILSKSFNFSEFHIIIPTLFHNTNEPNERMKLVVLCKP